MDLCPTQNLSAMQWIQEKNPYLAFRLLACTSRKQIHFPIIKFNIAPDSEVIFIEGVMRAFDVLSPFLNRGGKVVFIEKSVEKIFSFLALPDFVFHSNIEIIIDEEFEYQDIAKATCFKRQQFLGKLTNFRKFLDQYHLAISEYSDLGKTILRNIQGNLLHTKSWINGVDLQGKFQGRPAILCGSGPSLEENREKIIAMKDEVLIFAVGSSIPKLISWGIKIDAGFFVDPWPPIEIYEPIKQVTFPLFYQNRMSEELFKMHKGPKIWMGFNDGWEIEKWIYKEIGLDPFIFDAGWNVGCFGLNVSHFLGCDTITLIGMEGSEKRDLKEGAAWMKNFLENPPEYSELNSCEKGIDQEKLRAVIEKLNDKAIGESLTLFLDRLKNPIDGKGFQRAKILLEVDLEGNPIYEYLIRPLWNILKSHYLEEGKDEIIPLVLFAKRVLKYQQTYRFYQAGSLYSKETEDGLSEIFYETGENKAKVFFAEGLLNGEFSLFAKDGVCLREGRYNKGKKEGIHVIRAPDGNERIIAEFNSDVLVNKYIRKNEKGIIVEELFYHNPDQFDRRLYSEIGELKCEGVFQDTSYIERQYEHGSVISERKGNWKDGKLTWD